LQQKTLIEVLHGNGQRMRPAEIACSINSPASSVRSTLRALYSRNILWDDWNLRETPGAPGRPVFRELDQKAHDECELAALVLRSNNLLTVVQGAGRLAASALRNDPARNSSKLSADALFRFLLLISPRTAAASATLEYLTFIKSAHNEPI
jgi:hypothetical protein